MVGRLSISLKKWVSFKTDFIKIKFVENTKQMLKTAKVKESIVRKQDFLQVWDQFPWSTWGGFHFKSSPVLMLAIKQQTPMSVCQ